MRLFRTSPSLLVRPSAHRSLQVAGVAALSLLSLSACASDSSGSSEDSGGAGSAQGGHGSGAAGAGASAGGAAGDAGSESAGAAGIAGADAVDLSDPSNCSTSDTWTGSLGTVSPLISVGKPVAVSHSDDITNPTLVVDGLFRTSSACVVSGATEEDPHWIAIDLSGESASRLLLIWNDRGTSSYVNLSGNAPLNYRVEVSADSTDGSDGTWTTAQNEEGPIDVTDNPVRARGHSFGFEGMRWVRFVVTAPQPSAEGADPRAVALDEISIYDITASGMERPQDTWLFMGDSIAQGAFMRNIGGEFFFESVIASAAPNYTPAVISAGIGGEFASDGVEHIDLWLELNPDFTHIGINYGTNDSWGKSAAYAVAYESNLRTLIETILTAGRVPHLSRVPYASDGSHASVPAFNDVIDSLTEEYDLPCGPDLYTVFYDTGGEALLGTDAVHPSLLGYRAMNQAWAESVLPLYAVE